VLDALESDGLLAVSGDHDDRYLPAKALETLELTEVLAAVRTGEETALLNAERLPSEPSVDALGQRIEAAVAGVLGTFTLRDLVQGRVPVDAAAADPVASDDPVA